MTNISVTPRQLEVLDYVSKGYSNKEIAKILHIEVSTVKFHVAELLKRYQVRNRNYLIRISVREQVIAEFKEGKINIDEI